MVYVRAVIHDELRRPLAPNVHEGENWIREAEQPRADQVNDGLVSETAPSAGRSWVTRHTARAGEADPRTTKPLTNKGTIATRMVAPGFLGS
jgi:hypothetical protein